MKPSEMKQAILIYLKSGLSVYIHGAPGIGKSDGVRQVLEYFRTLHDEFGFRDIRASQLDAVDTRGLPTVKDQTTFWNTPSFWPTEGKGIIFLDELSSAVPLTKAALYQLILDRCLGDYKVPDGWYIIAAGNTEADNAIVSKDGTALDSRFAHIFLEVSLEDWISWAIKSNLYMPLIAFIKFRPEWLHKFEPKSKDRCFPCPRTVSFVSKLYESEEPIPKAIEFELVSGIVGSGFASDWIAFHDIFRKLPKPQFVLDNPETAPIVFDNQSILYALIGSLARLVKEETMNNFVVYLSRLPQEFSVLGMQQAVKRNNKLKETQAYITWACNNQDVFIN